MKFSSTSNPFVFNLLEVLGCTLVFSTYQSGTLVLISSKEGKVRQLTRAFKKPMGIALNEDQMALPIVILALIQIIGNFLQTKKK